MSEWQKVRIQFTDAEGKEVSAVMWQDKNDFLSAQVRPEHYNTALFARWGSKDAVKVTPIRELPTGLGAVIRCTGEFAIGDPQDDVLILDASGWWHGAGNAFKPEDMDDWQYEILSEGIEL